MLTHF